ncbi:MAG: hypothetical protein K9M96_09820 [Deltaproteobacteria bacterium]|nr:hypothetical protein [Deltaproteobacteria bacterium]MCF8119208.1 hypothetical protein [Deltaproteobacteria bacterium]
MASGVGVSAKEKVFKGQSLVPGKQRCHIRVSFQWIPFFCPSIGKPLQPVKQIRDKPKTHTGDAGIRFGRSVQRRDINLAIVTGSWRTRGPENREGFEDGDLELVVKNRLQVSRIKLKDDIALA